MRRSGRTVCLTSRGENGWENRFVYSEHDLSMGDSKLKRDGIIVSFDENSTCTCEARAVVL